MHVYDTRLEIMLLSCLKSFELSISLVFAPEMKSLLNVVDLHYQKRKYIQTTGAYQGYSAVTGVAVYRFINYGLLVEIKVFKINLNLILS